MEKKLSEFMAESAIPVNIDKVNYRRYGEKTDARYGYYYSELGEPIGWFRTKRNPFGYVVFPLTKSDKKWFKDQGQSTDGVYRITTNNGTNLVKINLQKNRVTFFDDQKYLATDKISWEPRSYTWELMLIDNNDRAFKEFGVNGAYK